MSTEHRETPTSFDLFWEAYPRRVGKLAAARAWKRLKPDPQLVGRMLWAITWQRTSRQWREGFVPHPTTWLNQGRWMDEPEQDLTPSYEFICPHTPHCGGRNDCHVRMQLEKARAS